MQANDISKEEALPAIKVVARGMNSETRQRNKRRRLDAGGAGAGGGRKILVRMLRIRKKSSQ
jgi:hypothetical protein